MVVRSLIVLAALFSFVASHAAEAPATELVFPGHSIADLRARWQVAKPAHQGDPFAVAPATGPPYVAGTLSPTFLDDGLRTLNFLRYLAGAPDDLALDPAANDEAQHGAVLLAKLGELTHAPTRPTDMPEDFYQPGQAACGSGSISRGYVTLVEAVRNWAADYGNLPDLGHRRWVLYPPMQRTGLGFCQGYSVMKTFGLPARPRVASPYAAIPWPPAGLFPVQLWDAGETWSVCLNPDLCRPGGQETVTLKRLSDGRTWAMTRTDQDPEKAYLAASTAPFGWPYCLAFRIPSAEVRVTPGEAYQVEVQGVQSLDGEPVALTWRTEFCSLGAALTGARLERPPGTPAGQPALAFAFTGDMPIASVSWRLFWLLGDGSGRYYTLGSGDSGPLAAGEQKLALPINMELPQEKAGAVYELDYTVTDQYGAFSYHVTLPVG
jgi:hypothetical protein